MNPARQFSFLSADTLFSHKNWSSIWLMVLFYFLQTDLCKTAMALLGRDNNEDLVCIIFVRKHRVLLFLQHWKGVSVENHRGWCFFSVVTVYPVYHCKCRWNTSKLNVVYYIDIHWQVLHSNKMFLLKITVDGVFSVLSQCTTVNVGETPAS